MVAISLALILGFSAPVDLAKYAGRRLEFLSDGYTAVQPILEKAYHRNGWIAGGSSILVERRGSGYVVIDERESGITPGQSTGNVSFFDSRQKFVSTEWIALGWRAALKGATIVHKPKVGSFIWKSEIHPESLPHALAYFGLAGNRVALIRVEDGKGRFARNSFGIAHWGYGPKPQAYTRKTLLRALSSPFPIVKLEALTWLAGDHNDFGYDTKPRIQPKGFNELKANIFVQDSVTKLKDSPDPWIAEAATAVQP